MRSNIIVQDSYYHICGKGQRGQKLFKESKDYDRFLLLILLLQGTTTFSNFSRLVDKFNKLNNVQNRVLHNLLDQEEMDQILNTRRVKLINFTLMPNHYHLTLQNISDRGISEYMHRVLVAYSKYFNTKYEISGHVFNGPYRLKLIENESYLLYLSAYIHRNISELKKYYNKEDQYYWSSYRDYLNENRWDTLLESDDVTVHFETSKEYRIFVKESGAKHQLDLPY